MDENFASTLPTAPQALSAERAVDLAALAPYAASSVVSTTLAKTGGGTLTLFAFDEGQELSEHTAPFDAVVLVLEGTAEIVVAGRSIPASAGQAVLLPADVPHAVRAPQRFKMLLVMLRSTAGGTE